MKNEIARWMGIFDTFLHNDFRYPYIKGKGGIPFPLIVPPIGSDQSKMGEVIGGSGAMLDYDMSPTSIYIADREADYFHLYAETTKKGVITFNLATRYSKRNRPHKDMHAGKFMDYAFHYFKQRGINIVGCQTEWRGGTNYFDFFHAIKNGKTDEEACWATWEGKRLAKLGLKRVQFKSKREQGIDIFTPYFYL